LGALTMKTAVLVDGGFFLRRFPHIFPSKAGNNPDVVAAAVLGLAVDHVRRLERARNDLYRIFFYDCPPLTKKLHLPISGRAVDMSKTEPAVFRLALHEALKRQRKVALRLGRLSDFADWQLKPVVLKQLRRRERDWAQLSDEDFEPGVRQKAVDMKIGLDIASLAYKHQVDQIVLVAGDADFVPAAKLARREGIDFILDPLWGSVPADLHEHIDGLQSVCPRPGTRGMPDSGVASPSAGP
jgi:uncharacterized protein (TIGR00288 family)